MVRFTVDLLNKDRKTVRVVVVLLTGHCRFSEHMYIMSIIGLAEGCFYRFCQINERIRFECLEEQYPKPDSYTGAALSRLTSSLIKTFTFKFILAGEVNIRSFGEEFEDRFDVALFKDSANSIRYSANKRKIGVSYNWGFFSRPLVSKMMIGTNPILQKGSIVLHFLGFR